MPEQTQTYQREVRVLFALNKDLAIIPDQTIRYALWEDGNTNRLPLEQALDLENRWAIMHQQQPLEVLND